MSNTPAAAIPASMDFASIAPVSATAAMVNPTINKFLIVLVYLASMAMEFAYSSLVDISGGTMVVLCQCGMCTFLAYQSALLVVRVV